MQKVPQFLKENIQDSLCWYCEKSTDCNSCSWVGGTPVKGWTVVENKNGVLVKDCPRFCLSRRIAVSFSQLAALLNLDIRHISYLLKNNLYHLERLINKKGFELEIVYSGYENKKGFRTLILKRIRRSK